MIFTNDEPRRPMRVFDAAGKDITDMEFVRIDTDTGECVRYTGAEYDHRLRDWPTESVVIPGIQVRVYDNWED